MHHLASRQVGMWNHVVLATLALALSACVAPRAHQFEVFSKAGVAYTDATGAVLEQAADAAIDADTLLLREQRPVLNPAERGRVILEHNEILRERLALLNDLERHAQLLRGYFLALGMLASGEAPSSIGGVAGELADALTQLGGGIEGKLDIAAATKSGTEILVARFRNAALETELTTRASTIDRELALQELAMKRLAEQLRVDLSIALQRLESNQVVAPFASDGPLPTGWEKARKELLQAVVDLSTLDAAADAARELRLSFIALTEGRLRVADLALLEQDMARVVELLDAFAGRLPVAEEG